MSHLARRIKRSIPGCLSVRLPWQEPFGYECWAVIAHMLDGPDRVLAGGRAGPRRALWAAWRGLMGEA